MVHIGLHRDMLCWSMQIKNEKTSSSEKGRNIRKIDENMHGMWSLDNHLFSS